MANFSCFWITIFLISACSSIGEIEARRNHGSGNQNPDNENNNNQGERATGQDRSTVCSEETFTSSGGCRTFQACCARQCGGENFVAACVVENGEIRGQCVCRGGGGGGTPGQGGHGHGHGHGHGNRPRTTTEAPWDNNGDGDDNGPRTLPTPPWNGGGVTEDSDDPYRVTTEEPFEPTQRPVSGDGSGQCGRPSVTPRVATSSGRRVSTTRIVGGLESTPHSWPWQISLQLRGQHLCGGSLVDNQHIVTAAHCFRASKVPSVYRVAVGLHDRLTPGSAHRTVNVERITVHPQYNSPNEHSNDIAVLRLSSPVPLSSSVSTICLAERDVQEGKTCVATGWGDTQGTGDNSLLLQVEVPIIGTRTCNDRRHYAGAIDDTMLCAGAEGRDSCQGDSGGPLVCQKQDGSWELHGVTSWGVECATRNKPGVYSKVSTLRDWIQEQLN